MSVKTWMSERSLIVIAVSSLTVGFLLWTGGFQKAKDVIIGKPIDKSMLALALKDAFGPGRLPQEVELDLGPRKTRVELQYSFDEELQQEIQSLFESYRPDYGSFVALDATTGRILSLISHNPNDPRIQDHMALRATFPSASVFKVVTAAAAISEKKANANTIIPFNGRPHTLYKNHVLRDDRNRWTNHITLREAFAKSVNTVFGKLGVFTLGPSELRSYADRFGFNRPLEADLPVQQGFASITEDPYEIAETASGFTRGTTMSPLQGALIAASIVNDGKMMQPYVVSSATDASGDRVYQAEPTLSSVVLEPAAAAEMRELMRETVRSGTSRGSFRGFQMSQYGFIDVGGKTGSLTGYDPEGKYDWFVGYGAVGGQRIAVAALTISKDFWRVKSSFLARRAIEAYFRNQYGLAKVQRGPARRVSSKRFVRTQPRRRR